MKQIKLLSCLVVTSATITFAFADLALSRSRSNLCQDLGEVKTAAQQLEKINGNSSIGELKEIQQDIFSVLGDLSILRGELGKDRFDRIRETTKNIDRLAKDIDDDSTLNDVFGKIIGEVIGIDNPADLIESLSECDI